MKMNSKPMQFIVTFNLIFDIISNTKRRFHMVNIDMIDKELYNSIYVSPRIGDYKEVWSRIKNNKEVLRGAIQITKDKFGERDTVKGLSIAEFMLLDYENVDSNIYQNLINTIYSNTDIARIVLDGASNGGEFFFINEFI